MDLTTYLEERRKLIDQTLDALLPGADERPETLHAAMRHSVFAGGKRLRPILCLAAADACGAEDVEPILPVASALELLHTYTLIHDDLPCMDDDDFRRGKPTCHKVYGEGIAVLAGDALQALAFEICGDQPEGGAYAKELGVTSGSRHLVGGQILDLEGETKQLTLEELRFVHLSKTAALLTSSVRFGGLRAGADADQLQALTDFGQASGLAFQIIDDILDVTQTSEQLGKSAGKDEASDKSTYPALLGLEASKEEAHRLTTEAHRSLEIFGERGEALEALATYLLDRDY
ncbi:MAG: polyprenyl synthetase family protein [Verrucomicrobiota bacterium]